MLDELLTIEELEANTRRLIDTGVEGVTVTPVGASWAGRPIEMITLGEGDRDALIVGIPHPNEPVGAVTIERMIALLLGPNGERERRGFRWHFIKAIDPEGLRLNGGWLKKPRTLEHYFTDFFRPALDRQPDTTFPVDCEGYRFDESTPENRAWQRAFELTRPKLHASLHGCEFGGAFHVLSHIPPELPPVLDQIIVRHGLTALSHLDQVGYPLEWASRGVARAPSVSDMIAADRAAGLRPGTSWPAGDTSSGYAEQRFGTFSITPEVPLWDCAGLRDDSPSGFTVGDQLAAQRADFLALEAFLGRYVDVLARMASSCDGEQLLGAIREMAQWVPRNNAYFKRYDDSPELARPLSVREYLQRAVLYSLVTARGYAMVGRLARMVRAEGGRNGHASAAEVEAADAMHTITSALETRYTLEAVPVPILTAVQMEAVLACAELVA